jgi:hypothetical protein
VKWRLDPGSYTLSAQDYQNDLVSPPVEINVAGKDIEGIALRLMHPSDLSGRILFDDADARFPPVPPNASLAEHPQISISIQDQPNNFSVIAADGSFRLAKVRPERYSVHVGENRYVKSMQLGSEHIEGSLLDLRNGFGDGALTITVSSAAGEISGIVRDADGPVPWAHILALGDPDGGGGLADRSGKYSIGLKPGKYQLLILDPGVINAFAIRYFLNEYADIIETVEVHAGESLTRNLRQHTKRK